MDDLTSVHELDMSQSAALKEICEQSINGITAPADVWEALEAKGIHATPGLLYQTISHLSERRESTPGADHGGTLPSGSSGITGDDLAVIASLAAKAGGIGQLMHILTVMQQMSKH